MKIVGVSEKADRVVRGGSWNNPARNLAASIRNRWRPGNRNRNIGFRVAVSAPAEHASQAELMKRAGDVPAGLAAPNRRNRAARPFQ